MVLGPWTLDIKLLVIHNIIPWVNCSNTKKGNASMHSICLVVVKININVHPRKGQG